MRINMSQLQEQWSPSEQNESAVHARVSFGRQVQISQGRPVCVILLLDEVEKASPTELLEFDEGW